MSNQYGNQGYNQPQGGYQNNNQGGYQNNNQGGYNNQGGNNNGGGRSNSGFDNYGKMQLIGRLVKDPESKIVGNSKVASSKIAFNHISEKAGTDYWFIEIWGNEGQDAKHNFLINHCPKGRKVFVEGVPELRQNKDANGNYTYFPTLKVTEIKGLEGGNSNDSGNQGGQQQQNQQQQPPNGQYGNQGGYQPPQQGGYQPPQAPPQAPPQGAPQGAPQGGFQQPPAQQSQGGFQQPQGAPQGGFPPNPPGGGYGAPVGVGAGAPNGGFPPAPGQ